MLRVFIVRPMNVPLFTAYNRVFCRNIDSGLNKVRYISDGLKIVFTAFAASKCNF
jgi:hypothetical protein